MLAKDPKNEQLLLGLAELLVMSGHSPDEVKATIDRAIAAVPKSTRPRLALINYYENLRDAKSALDAAKAAQAAFPTIRRFWKRWESRSAQPGQTDDALATFKRLVQLQPHNATALMRLAETEVAQKDYNAAIATLRQAIAAEPEQSRALVALAKTFVMSGHPEDAIAEARKLQKEPSEPRAGLCARRRSAGGAGKVAAGSGGVSRCDHARADPDARGPALRGTAEGRPRRRRARSPHNGRRTIRRTSRSSRTSRNRALPERTIAARSPTTRRRSSSTPTIRCS